MDNIVYGVHRIPRGLRDKKYSYKLRGLVRKAVNNNWGKETEIKIENWRLKSKKRVYDE